MKALRLTIAATAISLLATTGSAWAQLPASAYEPTVGQSGKDVVWVPTPQGLVDRMLDMAELKPTDKLVDLGSGDGRTVITAAQRGISARGIEFNPDMVAFARHNAEQAGVTERAKFEQADIFESDFSEATVITLFLLPSLNVKLRPTLLDMPPGTRILSNSFTMSDWQPDETAAAGGDCTSWCTAYKWVVPAKVDGEWQLGKGKLALKQTFQVLEGTLSNGSNATPITNARLDGANVTFTVGTDTYNGMVKDGAMSGTINGKTAWSAKR